jgi:hypothetical protein
VSDFSTILVAAVALPIIVVGGYVVWLAVAMRSRRPREDGFEYVYVGDDGTVRDLDDAEQRRMGDQSEEGASRPYVKLRYGSRDTQGRLRGYLKRRQVPPEVPIGEPRAGSAEQDHFV